MQCMYSSKTHTNAQLVPVPPRPWSSYCKCREYIYNCDKFGNDNTHYSICTIFCNTNPTKLIFGCGRWEQPTTLVQGPLTTSSVVCYRNGLSSKSKMRALSTQLHACIQHARIGKQAKKMNDQAKKNVDKYTSVGCELQVFIGTSKLRLFGELLATTATNRTSK